MQFIDLKTQYQLIKNEITVNFDDIMTNARFIMGEEVNQLEEKLAKYVGTKHCLTCSSGTDALLIALMALEIGKGDAVFVPAFTFYASAEVIALVGATPIFIDVREDTYNIDVEKFEEAVKRVQAEGKLKTKVVIPVDLFGLPADQYKLKKIADKYGIHILEDGAQGFGGSIDGKKACSFGDIAATSFFPAKPLGCYGDGGAIFTDNDELAELIKSIRVHGQGGDRYENIRLGLNGRLDTLQAAVLLAKLNIFDEELEKRNHIALSYTKSLQGILRTPDVPQGYQSSWAQYTLQANNEEHRTSIIEALKKEQIPTAVYYPIPLHKQKAFQHTVTYCDLSSSESLCQRVFSIPMHPYLTEKQQNQIIKAIIENVG